MNRAKLLMVLAAGCVLAGWATAATAAPTLDQRREAAAVRELVQKAQALLDQKKYDEAVAAVKAAGEAIEKAGASGSRDMIVLLDPLLGSLAKMKGVLELEGYTVAPLGKLTITAPTKPEPKPNVPPVNPAAPPAFVPPAPGAAVSYSKHIAPFMIAKCGRCHVTDSKGGFSAGNYAAMMKGTPNGGAVIVAGKGGIIIDKIESGDMPRGGGKVEAAELAMLKKWITDGAKFDGTDPKADIARGAPLAKTEEIKVDPVMASGKESISFARDIAPVLAESCIGCHGDQQPRANLSLYTIARMFKGGDSSAPVIPGKPAESLLLRKLKGTAGKRMPENKPPLDDAVIAKFEKWITEGAKVDGGLTLDMPQVAAVGKARMQSHEELAADRAKLAEKHWRLTAPDVKPLTVQSENFVVLGELEEEALQGVSKQAEAIAARVANLLKHPSGTPFIKGKMTIFVFKTRYTYTEFAKMVEKKDEIPKGSVGSWQFTVVDSYGGLVNSASGDYALGGLLAEQIAGNYLASLGAPRWFAVGGGWAIASRVEGKDSIISAVKGETPRAVSSMAKSNDFITAQMPVADAELASFGFVDWLFSGSTVKFMNLLGNLRRGDEFYTAFAGTYGGSPDALAANWQPSKPQGAAWGPNMKRPGK